ncbi:hypothetical protein [Streptomyces sp. NPDC002758]
MPTPRSMSRSDYETLSAAIADSDDQDINARRNIAFNIADALTGTGDRFDPILWLHQCKIGPFSPADVADWSTRLELRIKAIGAKRRNSLEMGYDIEQYIDASGSPITLDKA